LLDSYNMENEAVINMGDAYDYLARKRQEATLAALEEKKA